MRGMYRWNLFLKAEKAEDMVSLLREVLGNRRKEKGVLIAVDIDPY